MKRELMNGDYHRGFCKWGTAIPGVRQSYREVNVWDPIYRMQALGLGEDGLLREEFDEKFRSYANALIQRKGQELLAEIYALRQDIQQQFEDSVRESLDTVAEEVA